MKNCVPRAIKETKGRVGRNKAERRGETRRAEGRGDLIYSGCISWAAICRLMQAHMIERDTRAAKAQDDRITASGLAVFRFIRVRLGNSWKFGNPDELKSSINPAPARVWQAGDIRVKVQEKKNFIYLPIACVLQGHRRRSGG